MARSSVNIFIHAVWQTKCGVPMLPTPEVRTRMWQHMLENAREKGLRVVKVSGYDNHCHCLLQLMQGDSIQEVIRMIKGESSYWINQSDLLEEKFEWQRGYWSASVGQRDVGKVIAYLDRQEEKHRRDRDIDFPDEL